MAITLPDTDPATWYYRRLEPGRAVLIENTDQPWSVERTRWIARRKRVPAANIISAALGTRTDYYDPGDNQALWDKLLEPLFAVVDDVGAQGVYLGPGCPDGVILTGQLVIGSSYSAGAESATMLNDLVASIRHVESVFSAYGPTSLCWVYTPFGNYAYLRVPPALTGVGINPSNYRYSLTGVGGSVQPTYGTQYEGVDAANIVLPNQTALDLLGDPGNRSLLQGKFGVGYSRSAYWDNGTDAPEELKESSTLAGKILDRAIRYGEALNPANRYQQRVHFQFDGYTTTYPTICYLVQQMRDWGYDVDYFWRSAGNSFTEPYAPVSGSAYTLDDLQQGRVRDYPYHVMVGDASNQEMLDPPFSTAWQPTPGGGSYMGPSEGWLYALNGLKRGGGGGASNGQHISALVYAVQYQLLHNLLRGMTWAEAIYYSGYSSTASMYAVGDPMLTPFPRGDL